MAKIDEPRVSGKGDVSSILRTPDHVGRGDVWVRSTDGGATLCMRADSGDVMEVDLDPGTALDVAAVLVLSSLQADVRRGVDPGQTIDLLLTKIDRAASAAKNRGRA